MKRGNFETAYIPQADGQMLLRDCYTGFRADKGLFKMVAKPSSPASGPFTLKPPDVNGKCRHNKTCKMQFHGHMSKYNLELACRRKIKTALT